MSKLLSIAEVAELRGCDRVTAWRLLTRLEREHGVKLIRQRRTIFVDGDALAQIVAAQPARNERRMAAQIGNLKRRLEDVEAKQKSMDRELREFRRMSHEWLTKKR